MSSISEIKRIMGNNRFEKMRSLNEGSVSYVSEEKFDDFLNTFKQHQEELKEIFKDISDRISRIEKKIVNAERNIETLEDKFDKSSTNLPFTDETKIEKISTKLAVKLANLEKGDKGDKGDTPTRQELLNIILPLVPPAVSERTIINEVLNQIPKPNEKEIVERVLDRIPPPLPKVDEDFIVKKVLTKIPTDKIDAEEIKNKLESLPDARKLSPYAIKDLIALIKSSVGRIKGVSGGGGGMGDVVFKTFATSSSTTTLTLDDTPTSFGNALILIYQGAIQENGKHFTISGRIITLTFTPQDDTSMFAWMIR